LATSTSDAASRSASSRRHEGAVADLDVEHQRLKTGRQLLRQDRGGDQRNGIDRRCDVAHRVKLAVGGRQRCRLADDGATGLLHHLAEQRGIGGHRVAGNGFQLVERAAGMAEPAPRDHRHRQPAGRRDRRQHQRDVVADPAGRMLVSDRPADIGP
jgi:hypothetical protein